MFIGVPGGLTAGGHSGLAVDHFVLTVTMPVALWPCRLQMRVVGTLATQQFVTFDPGHRIVARPC
jgi:hypothetical protein